MSVAEPLIREAEPEVDLETANGLKKAAKTLEREANRKVKAQKTPEQLRTMPTVDTCANRCNTGHPDTANLTKTDPPVIYRRGQFSTNGEMPIQPRGCTY